MKHFKRFILFVAVFALFVGSVYVTQSVRVNADTIEGSLNTWDDDEILDLFTCSNNKITLMNMQMSGTETVPCIFYSKDGTLTATTGAIECTVTTKVRTKSGTGEFVATDIYDSENGVYEFSTNSEIDDYMVTIVRPGYENLSVQVVQNPGPVISFTAIQDYDSSKTNVTDDGVWIDGDYNHLEFDISAYSILSFDGLEDITYSVETDADPTSYDDWELDDEDFEPGSSICASENVGDFNIEDDGPGHYVSYYVHAVDPLGDEASARFRIFWTMDPVWDVSVAEFGIINNTSPELNIPVSMYGYEYNSANLKIGNTDVDISSVVSVSGATCHIDAGALNQYIGDILTAENTAIILENPTLPSALGSALDESGFSPSTVSMTGLNFEVTNRWELTGFTDDHGVFDWVNSTLPAPIVLTCSDSEYDAPGQTTEETLNLIMDTMVVNYENQNYATQVAAVTDNLNIGLCLSTREDICNDATITEPGIYYLFVRFTGDNNLATPWVLFDYVFVESPIYYCFEPINNGRLLTSIYSDADNENISVLYSQTDKEYHIFAMDRNEVVAIKDNYSDAWDDDEDEWDEEDDTWVADTNNEPLAIMIESYATDNDYTFYAKIVLDDVAPEFESVQFRPVAAHENDRLAIKAKMNEEGHIVSFLFTMTEAREFAGIEESVSDEDAIDIISEYLGTATPFSFWAASDPLNGWDSTDVIAHEEATHEYDGLNNLGTVFFVVFAEDRAGNSVRQVTHMTYTGNNGNNQYDYSGTSDADASAPKTESKSTADLDKETAAAVVETAKVFEDANVAGSENTVEDAKPADKASDGSYTVNGKTAANQFVKDGEKLIFTDDKGKPVEDTIIASGENLYFAKEDGTVAENEVVAVDDKGTKMIAGEDGKLITDEGEVVKMGKKTYVTGKNGKVLPKSFVQDKDGKTYRTGKNGAVKIGVFKADGEQYFANKKGVLQKNKLVSEKSAGSDEKIFFKTNKKGKIVKNKSFSVDGVEYRSDKDGKVTRADGQPM